MKKKLYIGIDIGGTKMSAALVNASGKTILRRKFPTPKKASPSEFLKEIFILVEEILDDEDLNSKDIKGIGIGIPGIVDTKKGKIVITPNINLSGIALGAKLKKKFKTKIAIGNDVNLGVLGEWWLGAAKGYKNVVGLFPGTGIGGGIIVDNKLLYGAHGAAAEVGHITIDLNGPKCSCGNKGCLEALAGRWAIERDIRLALKNKEKTIITKLTNDNPSVIKSKTLFKALSQRDPLVTRIIKNASMALGMACISLRHTFDPEVIVLGGGVIEACGDFMLPIIKKAINADPLFSKISHCPILLSKLGDDAVMLGAVALVKKI